MEEHHGICGRSKNAVDLKNHLQGRHGVAIKYLSSQVRSGKALLGISERTTNGLGSTELVQSLQWNRGKPTDAGGERWGWFADTYPSNPPSVHYSNMAIIFESCLMEIQGSKRNLQSQRGGRDAEPGYPHRTHLRWTSAQGE